MFKRIFKKKAKPAPQPAPEPTPAPLPPRSDHKTEITVDDSAAKDSKTKPAKEDETKIVQPENKSSPTAVQPPRVETRNETPETPKSKELAWVAPAKSPPQPKALLPVQSKEDEGKLCLVLDMDETLIHCAFLDLQEEKFRQTAGEDRKTDYSTPVDHRFEVSNFQVEVRCRPGLKIFLERCSKVFELVVFTASLEEYATKAMDLIDPGGLVKYRLFRPATVTYRGVDFVKDLSRLGRDMQRTILIDNNHLAMLASPYNSIAINDFMGDPRDTELFGALDMLMNMKDLPDVRPFIKETFQTHLEIQDILESMENGTIIEDPTPVAPAIPTTPKRISRPPEPVPATPSPSDAPEPVTPTITTTAELHSILGRDDGTEVTPTKKRESDAAAVATPKVLIATYTHEFGTPLRQIPLRATQEDPIVLQLPSSPLIPERRVSRSLSKQMPHPPASENRDAAASGAMLQVPGSEPPPNA